MDCNWHHDITLDQCGISHLANRYWAGNHPRSALVTLAGCHLGTTLAKPVKHFQSSHLLG